MNDKILEELRYYFDGYGSQHDETILKLIDQNKRYREVIKKVIDDLENECLWDALVSLKALEREK